MVARMQAKGWIDQEKIRQSAFVRERRDRLETSTRFSSVEKVSP